MKPQATEYILKVCEEDRLVVGVQNRPSYLKRILFFFQMVTEDFQGQIFFFPKCFLWAKLKTATLFAFSKKIVFKTLSGYELSHKTWFFNLNKSTIQILC